MSAGISLTEVDREVYQFAQLIAMDDQTAGVRILYDYWTMVDRFRYIRSVFDSPMMKFRFEEIPHIFALEHVCEELYDSLDGIVGESSPFIKSHSETEASEVIQETERLIEALAKFKKIRINNGWEALYREASNCAAAIISSAKMLKFYHSQRKTAHLNTNLKDVDEFFSSKVNFQNRKGKYLVRGE